MNSVTRRRFLARTATIGGAAATLTLPGFGLAGAAPADGTATTAAAADLVVPADNRYPDLVRGANQRFVGAPDNVRVVRTTQQVVDVVQQAVTAGKRIAVRSGGHCYENFVADPAVKVVIDTSEMNAVTFDATRRAFVIEAGSTLGNAYRSLFKGWGVTVPGGSCPTVGAGGHILGGGYGPLSRLHGLIVDHLYAVEVVVVDATGKACAVVATRETSDPNRDLWWGHTGGGGGNFGVVTRYFLRTPGIDSTDPTQLLPKPPTSLLVCQGTWAWSDLTEQSFSTLMRNYAGWYERNSAPDSPNLGLYSQIKPFHKAAGIVGLAVQVDASAGNPDALLDSFLATLNNGVSAPLRVSERRQLPWLHASLWNGFTGGDSPVTQRFKAKSSYLRRSFTDAQLSTIYRRLNDDYTNPGTLLFLSGFGGKINSVAASATATAQRSSILKVHYANFWTDPAEDARHIDWLRTTYQQIFAASGGVPAPDVVNDGAFINYADADLADPVWNTSSLAWHDLYYKGNYPALQSVKRRWDPLNIFHHALSVTA
ncbi:FAD-binding protein [Kutzneria sp. NPDC052558]|uniref:FAD-binding protein n=1 Tax=Kutzneria sp. NPDC052558 TaxID=3364121 RepID=UPI0037CB95EB